MPTRLFYNYYIDPDPKRDTELVECQQRNILCFGTSTIFIKDRPTFADIIARANEMQAGDDISIIANSDIYFESSSIPFIERMQPDEAYALGRWDVQRDDTSILCDRPDTMDAWIFRGPIRKMNGSFTGGIRGADNRLCWEMANAGYRVSNPCRTIKAHHLHLTGIRRYRHEMKFHVPPPYLTLHPCSLAI